MAAPSPRGGTALGTASGTSDATSFAVTLQTHAAGDTLFVFIASDGNSAVLSCTGWTLIGAANSTTSKGHLFRRDTVAASSSEPNPTFISTVSEQFAAMAYSVPGSALLNIEYAASSGSSAAADAPNLAPSAGSQDYLFIVFYAFDNATVGMSAGPTGYSTPVIVGNAVATGATAITAYKETTATSSDNPSAATNTSEQWAAFTIAVFETPAPPPPSSGGTGLMMGLG
jgi:hypothetical protein